MTVPKASPWRRGTCAFLAVTTLLAGCARPASTDVDVGSTEQQVTKLTSAGEDYVQWINDSDEGRAWVLERLNAGHRTMVSKREPVLLEAQEVHTPAPDGLLEEANGTLAAVTELGAGDVCAGGAPLFVDCGDPPSPPLRSDSTLTRAGLERSGEDDRLAGSVTAGGTTTSTRAGGKTTGGACQSFVVNYSCCDGVKVRAEPNPEASVIETLSAGDQALVYDLSATNHASLGISSAMAAIDDACDAPLSGACRSAVTSLALDSFPYWMEIVTPGGQTGYVPFGALHEVPPVQAPVDLHAQAKFGLAATELAERVDAIFSPPGCGMGTATHTVHAGPKNVYYNPALAIEKTACEDLVDCPEWTSTVCDEENATTDEAVAKCLFESTAECTAHDGDPASLLAAVPGRTGALGKRVCVKNSCPGKGTCQTCEAWFEQTGQDVTGARSELDLVESCAADLIASQPDGDIPPPCIGGQGPTCYDYCQLSMQTWNVYACQRYITAYDSRDYPNHEDYQCGEYPFGVTYDGVWQYPGTGEWVGGLDQHSKTAHNVPDGFMGHDLKFTTGRGPEQGSITVTEYDLAAGELVQRSLDGFVGPENVYVAYDPHGAWADVRMKVFIPGISITGPSFDNLLAETGGMVQSVDFGTAGFQSAMVEATARIQIDPVSFQPAITWTDFDFAVHEPYIGGTHIGLGPTYIAVWALPLAFPALRIILWTAASLAGLSSGAVNVILGFNTIGSLLEVGQVFLHDVIVLAAIEVLNQKSEELLAAFVPEDIDERVAGLAASLLPSLPTTFYSPVEYFYRYIEQQLDQARATATLTAFHRDAGSDAQGCYGTGKTFTGDSGSAPPLDDFVGQQWWLGGGTQEGCRADSKLRFTVDAKLHGTLRCATAATNAWLNTGRHGSLANVISSSCSAFGWAALTDMVGSWTDIADMYMCKHPPTLPEGI
jgi:hypothetical protein